MTLTSATPITLVKITSWEANGYDDSDWDTIYYRPDTQEILHDFGTTRGYCESTLPRPNTIMSVSEAVEAGIVTTEEVRNAFAADIFPENTVYFNFRNCYKNVKNLNWPVRYTLRSNSKEREGILIDTLYKSSRDWWGREHETVYAIIYDPILKKLVKCHTYNVVVSNETIEKISSNFIKNASITELSHYVSSKNSCSRFSSDWVAEQIVKSSIGLFEAPIMEVVEDTTITKTRKPSKSVYERAKAKVDEKTTQYRNWVNTLDETPEKREEIFNRTMNKYCSREMEIVSKYEAA